MSTKKDSLCMDDSRESELKESLGEIVAEKEEPYVDESFEPQQLFTRKDTDSKIETSQKERIKLAEKDFKSKSGFREKTLKKLITFLFVQLVSMNVIFGLLIFNQVFNFGFLREISDSALSTLSDLLKWYTTTVLAEMLGAFIFLLKEIFASPKI